MANKKKVQVKTIKGWAIIEEGKLVPFQFSYRGHDQYQVFPTLKEAKAWVGSKAEWVTIVPCTITYKI